MAAGAAASLTQEAGLLSLCPTREPTSTRPAPPTRQVPPKWGESSARSRLRTSKREEVAHGISDCRQLASSISTSSTAPSNLGQTPECSFPPYLFDFLPPDFLLTPERPKATFVATLARRAILARIYNRATARTAARGAQVSSVSQCCHSRELRFIETKPKILNEKGFVLSVTNARIFAFPNRAPIPGFSPLQA